MPRYFFPIRHRNLEPDRDGSEFPDDRAAWGEATRTLGEILRDIDGQLQPGPEWRMEVARDRLENVIFSVRFQAEDYRPKGSQPLRDAR